LGRAWTWRKAWRPQASEQQPSHEVAASSLTWN
jgi:hypothetical protein